jgi:hypothetical protein
LVSLLWLNITVRKISYDVAFGGARVKEQQTTKHTFPWSQIIQGWVRSTRLNCKRKRTMPVSLGFLNIYSFEGHWVSAMRNGYRGQASRHMETMTRTNFSPFHASLCKCSARW